MVSKNINLLYWFNFCSHLFFYAGIAILYFSDVSGSYALGMSVFSINYVAAALFEVPTGIYSDKIGRKNTILLGCLCSIIGVGFYALADSFLPLAIGGLFNGVARSFFSGNNDAFLYDSLAEKNKQGEYHKYYGKTSSAFQIALAIAALAGGLIATFNFRVVMWLSLIPQIAALLIAFRFSEPVHQFKDSSNVYTHLGDAIKQFKVNIKLRYISIAHIVDTALGESGFFFRAAFTGTLWPIWAIGISNSLSFMFGAIGFNFAHKIIDKLSFVTILISESIFQRIVKGLALVFPTIFSPALFMVGDLFWPAADVSQETLLQKEFKDKQRATMGSLNSLLGSIGFGIISFILGYTADMIGPAKALLLIQIGLLIPLYFYWKIFKNNSLNKPA